MGNNLAQILEGQNRRCDICLKGEMFKVNTQLITHTTVEQPTGLRSIHQSKEIYRPVKDVHCLLQNIKVRASGQCAAYEPKKPI
ncbi:MAG: hypothetical protein WAV41_05165 [Microgenomates group bacterium]